MKWFGVKSIYLVKATGRIRFERSDKPAPKSVMVEERVVLFRAKNADAAISAGEKDALEYSSKAYENIFGQKVRYEYIDCIESFELFEKPNSGVEVYSQTDIYRDGISKGEITKHRFGPNISERVSEKLRRKFLNLMFSS